MNVIIKYYPSHINPQLTIIAFVSVLFVLFFLCRFFLKIILISESLQHYYIYFRNLVLIVMVKHLKTNKRHHKFNLCNS